MKKLPRFVWIIVWAFLWCFTTAIFLVLSAIGAALLVLLYDETFPLKNAPSNKFERVGGWPGFLALTLGIFAVVKLLLWIVDKHEDDRMTLMEVDHSDDLKKQYGGSASLTGDDLGFENEVTINGKKFEGSHRGTGFKARGIATGTAKASVRFEVSDRNLELSIAQKSYWFAPPKLEPVSIVPGDSRNLLDVLSQRYDCYCSSTRVITAFIADADVQRELLPNYPNPKERSKLTIKNGKALLECGADTKTEQSVAEAAAFELMKKLLARAEIFDRRLTAINEGRA